MVITTNNLVNKSSISAVKETYEQSVLRKGRFGFSQISQKLINLADVETFLQLLLGILNGRSWY